MPDQKFSFIDTQQLAATFRVGDKVQVIEPRNMGTMAPVGTVTEVFEGLGLVDVEFPTTKVRVSPEELHRVEEATDTDDMLDLDPVHFHKDDVMPNFKRVATQYRERISTLYRDANHFCDKGIREMDAYEMLYQHHGDKYSDHEVKVAVSTAYSTHPQVREAMYWKEKGRHYCPTQEELNTGCFHCPRCKTEMKKTVYQKHTKLYACPECLFLITPSDILDSVDEEEREEVERQLGWTPQITPPSQAFNEWL